MDNLIEMLGKQVTPAVLGQLSGMMGESEEATGNAVQAALPSLMGAMVNKGSTESGAEELLGLMNNMPDDLDVTADLGGLLGDQGSSNKLAEMGGPMISGLLGDKAGGTLDMISSMAGIKKEGASSMMGMLAPMAMGMVKKQLGMGGGGMNASGLMSMLGGQSKFVEAAMPAGLSGVIGGLGDLSANLSGPDVDIKGPDVDLNMPDVDLNAPDIDIKGPDVDIKGPNVDLNAPDVDIKGPNVDLNAPDVDIKGPNVDLDGPDVDVNLKGADVDVRGPDVDIDKPSGGGIMRWLLPLLILLALLAGLLWYLLPGMRGGDMNANLDAGKVAVEGAVEAGADAVEGAVEAGKDAVEAGADAVEGAVEAGKDAVEGAVEAGGAAVEGAVEAGSEALCSGMGSINEALGGLPEINADTDAGVVGESFGVIKTAYDAMIEAIGDSEIPGMDVLTSAFEGLDGVVSGLPASGAIGDAFESVKEAFTSFTDSSKEFATGFACE